MTPALEFLARHGYSVVFAVVVLQQLGLPLPGAPILLAAGALARGGQLHAAVAVVLAVIAATIGHAAWFFAGRLRGARVLRLLCEISLEPDTCVRRTQQLFADRGALTLVAAPWIPGLGGVAPPLAGMSKMGLARFLALDGLGSLIWASLYVAAGFVFAGQIETILAFASRLGGWVVLAGISALALYAAIKYRERRKVLRDLALSRITASELKDLLDRGAELLIVDVRHAVEHAGGTLPGALAISFEELEKRAHALPRDRDVVLYCS
jgi:membrane protein DedA with SNARE-associated domain